MKLVKQIFAVLVIFVVVPFGLLSLIWKDRCKETRIVEHSTSDGTMVAAEISTDCGSAMKVATEVRLEKHSTSGVEESATVLVLAGKVDVPLHWSEGPTLTIDLPDNAEVVKHKKEWGGVTIAFNNIPQKPREELFR